MMKPNAVLGIDPGTGSSSACGLAAFEPDTLKIIFATDVWAISHQHPTHHRIKDIVNQVTTTVDGLLATHPLLLVGIESFVMRGKGGETLQRFIGAALTSLPYSLDVVEVANTSMKKFVGGRGASDKEEVALGVLQFFKGNDHSFRVVCELMETQKRDAIDALGIAIAASGLGPKRKGAK